MQILHYYSNLRLRHTRAHIRLSTANIVMQRYTFNPDILHSVNFAVSHAFHDSPQLNEISSTTILPSPPRVDLRKFRFQVNQLDRRSYQRQAILYQFQTFG